MGRSFVRRALRHGMVIVLAATSLLACDKLRGDGDGAETAPSKDAQEEPARDTTSFTGTWTTPWGPVKLVQTGKRVSGSYTGPFTGTLEGSVEDGVADVTWTQANGERGRARFTLDSDGDSFKGTWGSNASATNGGPWNGTRTKASGGLL
ncbi:MAG TPA: hypothetical protein ENK57_21495 [Polyangiaceae bacterium]|nr:hypothetical protein [Polyangiaceae bacterium]